MNQVTSNVLNTLLATAGDIVTSGGLLSITGAPTMHYEGIRNVGQGFVPSINENLQVTVVTPTGLTANTLYELTVYQYVTAFGNTPVKTKLQFTSGTTTPTATAICNAWRSQMLSYPNLKITGSGTATLIMTAQTGAPLFTVLNTSTPAMTIASGMATASMASNTTADPTVCTFGAPHGFVVGDIVTVVSANQAKLVDGTYRVLTTPLATTLTMEEVDGSATVAGTATTTATFTLVASYSRGTYADLVAAGVTGAVAGDTYSQAPFTWTYQSIDSNTNQPTSVSNLHTLYVNEGAANFSAFKDRINEVLNAYAPASTNADPSLIAVPH